MSVGLSSTTSYLQPQNRNMFGVQARPGKLLVTNFEKF